MDDIHLKRLIRTIPAIIQGFKSGMSVDLYCKQMSCSSDVIEEIIRLGFKIKLKKANFIELKSEDVDYE